MWRWRRSWKNCRWIRASNRRRRCSVFRVLAHNDPLYPLQPSATLWRLDELHRIATGRRVRVAEIDTGVDVNHPDLAGRVAVTRNFVDGRRDVAERHGTAIAGIIGARADDGIGIAGIAPEAKLLALRACWQAAGVRRHHGLLQHVHLGQGAAVRARRKCPGDQSEPWRTTRPAARATPRHRLVARYYHCRCRRSQAWQRWVSCLVPRSPCGRGG